MVDAAPIPWRFQGTPDGPRVWRWETPHFVVTIIGEGNSFRWDIGDLVSSVDGYPVSLMDGVTSEFSAADVAVREIVGKSYLPSLGYAKFAGSLATTFMIATGEAIDFGQFEGTRVIVTVGLGEGETVTISGQAAVRHYELLVAQDSGETVRVLPHRVRSIIFERGGYDQIKGQGTGVARMYRGDVTRGCTGSPGFLDGTVEHSGSQCPVHEYNVFN